MSIAPEHRARGPANQTFFAEQALFPTPHLRRRLRAFFVIKTEEMKDSMDHERAYLGGQGVFELAGLLAGHG